MKTSAIGTLSPQSNGVCETADSYAGSYWCRGWLTGFSDAEGCFSINFIRQPDLDGRRGYTLGYQVAHEFAVTQAETGLPALRHFLKHFACGSIVKSTHASARKKIIYRYVIRKRVDLLKIVIPFFDEHPPRTSKRDDYQTFKACMSLVTADAHKKVDGLIAIIRLAETMNHRRSREHIVRQVLKNA